MKCQDQMVPIKIHLQITAPRVRCAAISPFRIRVRTPVGFRLNESDKLVIVLINRLTDRCGAPAFQADKRAGTDEPHSESI